MGGGLSMAINEALDNFGKKVKSVASNARDEAVKLAKKTQLKIDLKNEEANLAVVFEDLGKAYYELVKKNKNDEEINKIVARADEIKEKIKVIEKKIADISND